MTSSRAPILWIALALLAGAVRADTAPSASPAPAAPIAHVKLPWPADAIDARYDAEGTLHVLSVRSGKATYGRRPAKGGWGPAVEVGALASGESEGRPRIAPGGGDVYALWRSSTEFMLYRSTDSGKTWARLPTGRLLVGKPLEVAAMIVGGDGALHIAWVDERDPLEASDKVARHMYVSSSHDKGKTFSPPRKLTTDARRACPCCEPAMVAGPGALLWVAYRSSVKNFKEIVLAKSADSGKTFTEQQITNHHWYLEACPASGPSIAASKNTVALIWNSQRDLFESTSTDGGKTFPAPTRLGPGSYHQAAAAPDAAPMLVWESGDHLAVMRTDGSGRVVMPMPARGTLVAGPGGKYELVDFDRGED